MKEWKDIEGYEGLYQISNEGEIRNVRNNKNLKIFKTKYGYFHVILSKNGKTKQHIVHRIVADAFIPNPKNYPCVNHKNECKDDNSVENLEWCDWKYNCNYGTRNKRMAKSLSKKVYQYTLDGTLIKIWKSTREAETIGYSHQNIASCCRGVKSYNTYKGYRWSYKPL